MEITKLGIDLAKNTFYVCGKNKDNEIVLSKKISSGKLRKLLVDMPPCEVFMESCAGSGYWGRFCEKQGHSVKLIAPQHVKPYVTSNQKNDRNDTLAILEAASRPGQYFQKPKNEFCQELQMLLKTREFLVRGKVSLTNHARGMMLELGVTITKGDRYLKEVIVELLSGDASEFSYEQMFIFETLYKSLCEYESQIKRYTQKIEELSSKNRMTQRLMEVPGIGPISASWYVSFIGTGEQFKNGRQASACLGLVPRQRSTGGRQRLLGITKQGNVSVRTTLIHGARAYVRAVQLKKNLNKYDEWVKKLVQIKGTNKTAVAVANKNARILWSMIRKGTEFRV